MCSSFVLRVITRVTDRYTVTNAGIVTQYSGVTEDSRSAADGFYRTAYPNLG